MRSIFSRLIVVGVMIGSTVSFGETVSLPVTRDTWFSNVGSEADANTGGSPRLKLKSIQEMSLIDVDVTSLRGKVIKSATLHVKSSGAPALQRVTISSFGSEWFEGKSPSYTPEVGSSTHNHKRHPDGPWTVPGSDLCAVMLGQGGTTWAMAEATPPDKDGWQTIAVEPRIVALRVAGLSYGFLMFDDTGTTWVREGEKFTSSHFPNRFVMSRDSNRTSAPYLTVTVEGTDTAPPATPRERTSEIGEFPAGEAWVAWETPMDTLGFDVSVDNKPLPRYLIPLPKQPASLVRMHLRDLGRTGGTVNLNVRAVDAAGNRSAPLTSKVPLSSRVARDLPGAAKPEISNSQSGIFLPKLGSAEVAIIDELDKVQPETGEMIPPQPKSYLASNHLWNAKTREIQLKAGRNEFIGFQVFVNKVYAEVRPSVTFEGANIGVTLSRYQGVNTKKGVLPDPLVPLTFRSNSASKSYHVDLYVPHNVAPATYRGTLRLEAAGQSLSLPIALKVWDLTLPDTLSFLPEMNCYGLPENEREYYRLAHAHRVVLNRLPYSQNGLVHDGAAPVWDGKKLDWTAWDRRFGPYLDGSAFADLPRKNVPIELFYLPLHENWPTQINPNYNGNYWADHAFTKEYREAFVSASRQIAEHVNERKWDKTFFHGFLNNKVDFKAKGWSRGSSPWLLDEPANFQDFWALRYFAQAFHAGVAQVPGDAKLVFRADISRPEWQRDSLDGLLDYNVVGGAMRKYHRIVLDRKAAEGQVVVEYGSANAIEEANTQAVAWTLDAWSLGVDGVLPWQTIGRAESWMDADTLALFYPNRNNGPPVPSIRLKAFRRGQQDAEYLTLYSRLTKEPRWAVGQKVRETLGLAGERKGSGFAGGEDAGVIHYGKVRPADDWALRERLGEALSGKPARAFAPAVELRTPRRSPSMQGRGGEVRP